MTITADYQIDLGGVTLGPGTAYRVRRVSGLGVPVPRSRDVTRIDRYGDAGGADLLPSRIIGIDVIISNQTVATAWTALRTLKAAWPASSTDQTLTIRWPGSAETTMTFYGRSRGVDVVTQGGGQGDHGVIFATCMFHALDPLQYGASVSTGPSSGTFTVTNAGDSTSDRCTITIVGSGGTPTITNTTDSSGAITWASTLAGAASRTIDLRAKTVVDGSGNDKFSEVSPSSTWFRLLSGSNSITTSGLTSATFAARPAYL